MALSANAAPPDDACALRTQAQLSAALSVSVGAGSYRNPTLKKTCAWNTTGDDAKGAKFVTPMLEGLDAYQGGKPTGPTKSISVMSIGGIGDDAYYLAVGSNTDLMSRRAMSRSRSPCTATNIVPPGDRGRLL
jgi:hypothetical protein